MTEQAEQAKQGTEQAAGQAPASIGDELRNLGREVALEALKVMAPAAKQAAGRAAQEVAERAPGMAVEYGGRLVKRMGKSAGEGAAGAVGKSAASAAGGLASKLTGGGGGGSGGGGGKGKLGEATGTGQGRRLPIQESVDVGVPIEAAYAQWTQFEEFAKYMFRTEETEQKDDTHLVWRTKIWGIRRSFEAEITEQKPKERIVWKATGGANHVGVITFHPLAHNLTRVQVNLDFQPSGLLEKTGSGLRATRRAVKSDLMRFKALIEMRQHPSGEWPGTIEEGEVVQRDRDEEGREQPDDSERDGDGDQAEGQEPQRDEPAGEGQEAEKAEAAEAADRAGAGDGQRAGDERQGDERAEGDRGQGDEQPAPRPSGNGDQDMASESFQGQRKSS